MVTSAERLKNHPIYSLEIEMGFTIFFMDGDEDGSCFQNATFVPTEEELGRIWHVDFYGSACGGGAGAEI